MKLLELLEEKHVPYKLSEHRPTFTSQTMAQVEHEPGRFVAKPVVIKADGEYYLCVLSAAHKIDMEALKDQMGADSLELASEKEIAEIFEDCEIGAEPPFGKAYGLETIMDTSLEDADHILFQAGEHDRSVRISLDDYKRLETPRILSFSYHQRY